LCGTSRAVWGNPWEFNSPHPHFSLAHCLKLKSIRVICYENIT